MRVANLQRPGQRRNRPLRRCCSIAPRVAWERHTHHASVAHHVTPHGRCACAESRVNCDDDPPVARDRWASLIGHPENEVHGLRSIDPGGDQRNIWHILSQGQLDAVFVRPRFGVLKPEKTEAVAIRVASVSVQVKLLAGADRECFRDIQDGLRRMIAFFERLRCLVHARREIVLKIVSPPPDRGFEVSK
jgi:hypothetical protein